MPLSLLSLHHFCHFFKVTALKLHQNQLEGAVPEELCKLTRAAELRLSSNLLQGPIPNCWSEAMQELHLVNNNFTGPLPAIHKLTKLVVLDVSHNDLTGSISTSISSLIALHKLLLTGNQMTGTVPTAVGRSLTKLTRLTATFVSTQSNISLVPDELLARVDSHSLLMEISTTCDRGSEWVQFAGSAAAHRTAVYKCVPCKRGFMNHTNGSRCVCRNSCMNNAL